MKETGMLFNADMVRAILQGRKTQTRRIMKLQPGQITPAGRPLFFQNGDTGRRVSPHSPYGLPGDRLWVRETWAHHPDFPESTQRAIYRAERGVEYDVDRWRPSIHMPRWASRIDLEITNVRVERLNEINEADAEQEGCAPSFEDEFGIVHGQPQYTFGFRKLWESINGAGSWDLNPFCWVIEFKRAEKTN